MTVGIRTRAMLGIAAILAMAAAACSSASAGSAAGGSSQGATTVQIRLTEFAISPETVNAPAGRPIAFDVTNDGTADHTFAVQVGSELYETPPIAAGASATLEVDALDPGTYRTSCTVAGHADLGMQGQLVVGDA
ncbi:MAG: cupredoxin domain-containing protein, partial [Candidatus Velamenicoccus archaeovorus]